MANKWLPPYIQITSQTIKDNKAVITYTVKTRHPAWWVFMWKVMLEYCHNNGVNPWRPQVVWVMVKVLAATIIK